MENGESGSPDWATRLPRRSASLSKSKLMKTRLLATLGPCCSFVGGGLRHGWGTGARCQLRRHARRGGVRSTQAVRLRGGERDVDNAAAGELRDARCHKKVEWRFQAVGLGDHAADHKGLGVLFWCMAA